MQFEMDFCPLGGMFMYYVKFYLGGFGINDALQYFKPRNLYGFVGLDDGGLKYRQTALLNLPTSPSMSGWILNVSWRDRYFDNFEPSNDISVYSQIVMSKIGRLKYQKFKFKTRV